MMLSLVLYGLGLVALAQSAKIPASPNLTRDLATAQAFAKHVTGPHEITANWTRAGGDLCSWDGFFCKKLPKTKTDYLSTFDVSKLQLTGDLKLGGFLDKFVDLDMFHINGNGFSGEVPNLSALQHLSELDISDNKFSGSFPTNVLTASGLIYLDLRFNNFHGPLPAEVYTKLSQIKDMILNNNAFTGTITDSIGAFPGEVLSLANNKFTGPIPSTLAKATGLNEFVVLGNQLTGSIPTGLGALKKLKVFDVSQNRLTGTVPEDLCSIKTLGHLILSGNKLDKHLGPMCAALKKKGILKI